MPPIRYAPVALDDEPPASPSPPPARPAPPSPAAFLARPLGGELQELPHLGHAFLGDGRGMGELLALGTALAQVPLLHAGAGSVRFVRVRDLGDVDGCSLFLADLAEHLRSRETF